MKSQHRVQRLIELVSNKDTIWAATVHRSLRWQCNYRAQKKGGTAGNRTQGLGLCPVMETLYITISLWTIREPRPSDSLCWILLLILLVHSSTSVDYVSLCPPHPTPNEPNGAIIPYVRTYVRKYTVSHCRVLHPLCKLKNRLQADCGHLVLFSTAPTVAILYCSQQRPLWPSCTVLNSAHCGHLALLPTALAGTNGWPQEHFGEKQSPETAHVTVYDCTQEHRNNEVSGENTLLWQNRLHS